MNDSDKDIETNIRRPIPINTILLKELTKKHLLSGINLNDKSAISDKELEQKKELSIETISSFGAQNTTQAMLAAQMSSVHDLQQHLMIFAKNTTTPGTQSYYINSLTKLSNLFVQQATLLQKLQSAPQDSQVVGDVHVHQGGQAVVGNIHTQQEEKK